MKHGADIDLVITGGLRVSSDFAKALAMGADAVAIASAALIAAACQQYRICGTGMCRWVWLPRTGTCAAACGGGRRHEGCQFPACIPG